MGYWDNGTVHTLRVCCHAFHSTSELIRYAILPHRWIFSSCSNQSIEWTYFVMDYVLWILWKFHNSLGHHIGINLLKRKTNGNINNWLFSNQPECTTLCVCWQRTKIGLKRKTHLNDLMNETIKQSEIQKQYEELRNEQNSTHMYVRTFSLCFHTCNVRWYYPNKSMW